jgi:TatD DNase family protein
MLYNSVFRAGTAMSLLVDSHCHINFEPLGAQLEALFDHARLNGVGHMLCVAVNLEDYPQVRALAHAHPQVFASVGVHPNERDGRDPDAAELVTLAQDGRVVAIGETGLDYFRSSGDMDWQHRRFREHIRAARSVRKPLIIHTREAVADTLRILKEEGAHEVGGVMHCFTEDWDTARQALEMNFYISFSGIVTFRNAVALRAVAAQVPADKFLIETDAPYLAPMPYRGKTNEPAYVRHVAECLAEVRAVPFETIAEQTTRNFFTLFSHARPIQ